MKIIDLTQTIKENIPVFPGTEKPSLSAAATYENDGFKETLLSMFSHTGTHMDAPNHLFKDRITLDAFPASQFVGTALVVDCRSLQETESKLITMEFIMNVKEAADKAEFILFHTGWDCYWETDTYFGDFPHLSVEVAGYLIDGGKKGVGIDTISIDSIFDANLTVHKLLLGKAEMVIVENLTNLGLIGSELFTFCALPLKFNDSDGAPVRAVAIANVFLDSDSTIANVFLNSDSPSC